MCHMVPHYQMLSFDKDIYLVIYKSQCVQLPILTSNSVIKIAWLDTNIQGKFLWFDVLMFCLIPF